MLGLSTHTHTHSIYMLNVCAFHLPVLKWIIEAALTKCLETRTRYQMVVSNQTGKKPGCNVWARNKDTAHPTTVCFSVCLLPLLLLLGTTNSFTAIVVASVGWTWPKESLQILSKTFRCGSSSLTTCPAKVSKQVSLKLRQLSGTIYKWMCFADCKMSNVCCGGKKKPTVHLLLRS